MATHVNTSTRVNSGISPDLPALTQELMTARSRGQPIADPPSARPAGLDLTSAYLVEAELARMRRDSGHIPVGYKVGFANKAVWRVLGLETLVWAHMYDDTVSDAAERSEERRVGKECGYQCRSRWSPYH